jgi:hypothetical protein
VPFGVLGLGQKESIRFSSNEADYGEIDGHARLYRRLR